MVASPTMIRPATRGGVERDPAVDPQAPTAPPADQVEAAADDGVGQVQGQAVVVGEVGAGEVDRPVDPRAEQPHLAACGEVMDEPDGAPDLDTVGLDRPAVSGLDDGVHAQQPATVRDWLAVVGSAPVTVEPDRLRSRRTSTPLPSNPGRSHRSTVSSCSVAPLIWSGASNWHSSNVSGNGTVIALRSSSPATRALRRCRPRSSTSSRRSRPRLRTRSAATLPQPSPSPQSTASPARADSITSSGATTLLLSDATIATSQRPQGTAGWSAAVPLSTFDASVRLGLQPPTGPEARCATKISRSRRWLSWT